jgi:hypothetical protein
VQEVLQCDGLLGTAYPRGVFDYTTLAALKTFQRRHMIVSGGVLDGTTRGQLLEPRIERDFAAVLRGLRERVVAATGLIEDGSASCEQAEVVGHRLDMRNAWSSRRGRGSPAARTGNALWTSCRGPSARTWHRDCDAIAAWKP